MILSDNELIENMQTFVGHSDTDFINPASIDIRVGNSIIFEDADIEFGLEGSPYILEPGEFVLLSTLETISVPWDYAMDLRLKSSIARKGINHALAFWFDPGWHGVGTMEIFNQSRTMDFKIEYGMRIAQIVVHQLSSSPRRPYQGKYQGALSVEASK